MLKISDFQDDSEEKDSPFLKAKIEVKGRKLKTIEASITKKKPFFLTVYPDTEGYYDMSFRAQTMGHAIALANKTLDVVFPNLEHPVSYRTWRALTEEKLAHVEQDGSRLLFEAGDTIFSCDDYAAWMDFREWEEKAKEQEGLFEEMEREAEREMEKFRREEDRALRVLAGGEEWEEKEEEGPLEEEEKNGHLDDPWEEQELVAEEVQRFMESENGA